MHIVIKKLNTFPPHFMNIIGDISLGWASVIIKCHHMLKLQSVTFTSLSPSMFENLELQLLAELSSVHRVVIRCSGTAPARMNLMFWGECVVVSHRTGVDIYCTSQSQILAYVLEYMTQIRIFRILPSEQVSNKSATFVLPNGGKKHYNKLRHQWWLNLKIG